MDDAPVGGPANVVQQQHVARRRPAGKQRRAVDGAQCGHTLSGGVSDRGGDQGQRAMVSSCDGQAVRRGGERPCESVNLFIQRHDRCEKWPHEQRVAVPSR